MQIYRGTDRGGKVLPNEYVLRESGGFGQVAGQRSLLGFDPTAYGLDPNTIGAAPQGGVATSKGDTSFDKVLGFYRQGEANDIAMKKQITDAAEANAKLKASGFRDVPATPLTMTAGSAGDIASKGGSFQQQAQSSTAQLPNVFPVDPNAISKRYEQAVNNAKAAGVTSPSDYTGANEMYKNFLPDQQGTSVVDDFVSKDPYLGSVIKSFQDYMGQQNQRTSLVDTYKSLLKESGVQEIDTELINMKKVIEGTEDDIRTEVTKAGGFATDSQVIALGNARNKQLIKNYNTLLETRNSKEKYLDNIMSLTSQDRQEADKRFEIQMNFGTKIAEINQTMKKSAVETIDRLQKAMGWDGIWNATGGNQQLISQLERTYGLPAGGLFVAARQADIDRYNKETKDSQEMALKELQISKAQEDLEMAPLERQLKSEQIKTEQAQRAKIYQDIQKIQNEQKGSILDPTTAEGAKQLGLMKAQVDQVGNILNSGSLNNAVGTNIFSRTPESKKGILAGIGDFITGGPLRRLANPGISNFVGDVEQLRSQLNLQSLIDSKVKGATFCALSDQELQVLSNSATKIGTWTVKDAGGNVAGYNAKQSDFKKELDKINNFAKLDYIYRGGKPEDVGVQVIDGKYYTKNHDGSMTEL